MYVDSVYTTLSDTDRVFLWIKAADPEWEAVQLVEPTLDSHIDNPEILSAMSVPDRRYITSYDPSTGLHLGTFLADNEHEIEQKIDRAAEAQRSWKNTTFQQRRRVIRSLQKWLVDNQEVVARVACRDTGKTCE
jgi:acyl-CoA reductase-like NAD-dependent aldehyde dehydrogenase